MNSKIAQIQQQSIVFIYPLLFIIIIIIDLFCKLLIISLDCCR